MNKKHWTLETLSCKMVWFLGTLIFLVLTGTSLLFTRYFAADYSAEIPYERVAWFPLTLLGAVALGGVIWWISGRISEEEEKGKRQVRALLLGVLLWCLVVGTVWVLLAASTPVADQLMITSSAERFAQGNYGRLEYGKYLFYYPFQLGLVAYMELVFKLFGLNNYIALQIFNVLGIAGSVYAGCRIVSYLFDKRRVEAIYLMLAALCFPFLIFSAYLYSDVLSIFGSLIVIWQLLRFLKAGKKDSMIWMALAGTAAVLLRSNSLIVLIAVGCVLAVKGITGKEGLYLLCILLLGTGVMAGRQAVNRYYEAVSGTTINDGMPSVLWIAMGMQEGDKEAGWYNGYSMYTYQDVCQYHGPTAKALGIAEIRARAKEFLTHPLYAADFYFRKFTSQWNDPTYGCFIMTYATDRERSALGESLYRGMPKRILEKFMDCYQLLIYGAVLFLLVYRRKGKRDLEWYVLLIAVIGGVLFHELWEAKSRYVLPYFIMMIPMAAAGLENLGEAFGKWRTKDETAESGR